MDVAGVLKSPYGVWGPPPQTRGRPEALCKSARLAKLHTTRLYEDVLAHWVKMPLGAKIPNLSPAFPKLGIPQNWEPSVPLPENPESGKSGPLSIPLSKNPESGKSDTLLPPSGFP